MILQFTEILYPIWENVFFYLFIIDVVALIGVIIFTMKIIRKKTIEYKLTQTQHVARIDAIRKEHSETMEKIRVEMLKREEERSRQWIESEKETLHVLNGVSTLLDLSEKIGGVESEKILKLLGNVHNTIENFKTVEILKTLNEIQEKVEKLSKQ